VILTVPLKTAAIDHTWATDQPNWFVRDNTYNLVTDPATPYLANFDYTNPELKQAIYEALKPWVVTQDVDGFLFDGATSVPVAFVDELAYRLQALKSLLIGTTDQYSDAYQSSLYANSNDALRALLETQDNGTLTNASFTSVINDMNANYSGSEFTFNAVSNYATMVGLQTETARMGPALPAAVALTFTLPGAPSIFQGQEVGSIKALKPYDADNVVWPTKDPAVLATYIKLVKLKKLNAALFSGSDGAEVSTLPTASKSLLAFKRTVGKNTVMVVVNLSKKALTTKFDAGAAATMFLFSNDKSVKLAAKANAVTLPAFGYEIYTPAVVK
jgi:glycosidase